MKVFGLTGGIGMGKSAAAEWLRQHNFPVADTDLLARRVVAPGQPACRDIRETFGPQFFSPDGQLRRDELARIVFSDATARQKLERITHPRIRELWRKALDDWRSKGHDAGVVVIPLLFETGAEKELDSTVCVACSAATQRRRLLERGLNAEQIESRIAAQWPIEKKMAHADFVIWSEGSLDVLQDQLARVFES